MNKKIKVSREVEEAIESVIKANSGDRDLALVRHAEGWHGTHILSKISMLDFAKFLLGNYEIEQTPEEQVQDYYAEIARHVEYSESNGELNKAGQDALKIIRDIVGILGHKIKGINE